MHGVSPGRLASIVLWKALVISLIEDHDIDRFRKARVVLRKKGGRGEDLPVQW